MRVDKTASGLLVPAEKQKKRPTLAQRAMTDGLTLTGRGRALFYDPRLGRAGFDPDPKRYHGTDALEAGKRHTIRGHALKLMPCKPFKKGKKSRRVRKHTWVRI